MPIIRYTGRVMPESLHVTMVYPLLQVPTVAGPALFNVSISRGNVDVVCEIQTFNESMRGEIFARANDLVRSALNLISFESGLGLILIFDSISVDTSPPENIFYINPSIAGKCTAYTCKPPDEKGLERMNAMFKLQMDDLGLQYALTDLSYSLILHHQTPIICGRAIEALRHSLHDGKNRNVGWSILKNDLNVEEAYIKHITESSHQPRHGNWVPLTESEVQDIIDKTWAIVDRYIHYRLNGSKPLDTQVFTLLSMTPAGSNP